MSVWITGDTHIPHDVAKLTSKHWPKGKTLTKKDYLIICGDFGLIWKNVPDSEEQYWTKWLNNKPWTTLFVDGNHENHSRLYNLPVEEKLGSDVGIVSDSIWHLKRGEIYTIENKTFFCMGGALSIDKLQRTEWISWWKSERPSYVEKEHGLTNLDKFDNKVDYLITHTLPLNLRNQLKCSTYLGEKWYDDTCKYLEHIYDNVKFKKGYCGHWHMDQELKKYTMLYNDIIQVF